MKKDNKYYPFENEGSLLALCEVLSTFEPENDEEASLGVCAKWHKENPRRGEGGSSTCSACKTYMQVYCSNCFMIVNDFSCTNGDHPYVKWCKVRPIKNFCTCDHCTEKCEARNTPEAKAEASKQADIIFNMALTKYGSFQND